MFEALGFTKEKANEQFGFLINAFKYGVPPHAGLAYGLDRLIMLMDGKIILDIKGEEKKKLTVEDLLHQFEKASGEEFANDRALLS